MLPHEADLLHKQWMRLNRLRCGSARVSDTTKLWGTQESVMCLRTTDTVGAACVPLQDGSAGIPKSMKMYTLRFQ